MPIFSDARPSLYSGRLVRGDFSDAVRALEIYIGRQSGDFLFGFGRLFFYSVSTFGCIAFFVFLNEEYLIALVDFIAPRGGTKGQGRRDLRIPPSLSSGL